MSKKKLIPYKDCPQRIVFRCHQGSDTAVKWFNEAFLSDKLRNTFDGSIRTLCPRGKIGEVYVRTIKDPTRLSDATFYLSAHNNYHIGNGPDDRPDWHNIQKMNPGGYSYFQDEKFFLAVKRIYCEEGTEHILLCITKKKECDSCHQARQD